MKLTVITEKQFKNSKFGKWLTSEIKTNEYINEEVSRFEHNFFSYNMDIFGAKETNQYGYTCNGYKVVKNFNTLNNERVVTTFKYSV